RAEAITQMRRALADAPDYYWGWQQLAGWLEMEHDHAGHLRAAEQLVRLAPRDPVAYGFRAEARRASGGRPGAKDDFRPALQIAPEYGFAGLNLLDEQITDNELDDAAETLAKLQERGDDAFTRLQAVRLAVKRDDREGAERLLTEFCDDDEAPPHLFAKAFA